jgi:hypothetical protein
MEGISQLIIQLNLKFLEIDRKLCDFLLLSEGQLFIKFKLFQAN